MTEFNTPSHYKLSDGSDSMNIIAKILGPEEFKGFLRGNAIKYLIRYKLKGGIEDLKKARDYIARLEAVEAPKNDFTKKANKYTKKPLAIEAIKYDKDHIGRAQDFCDELKYNPYNNEYYIQRSDGCMKVVDGDFIIKGIDGEFYTCKADFFEKTYEPMTSEELSKTE